MHENPLGSLLKSGALLRILEAVNGLEAYVAEHAFAPDAEGNQITFDGLWLSGLCHAAAAGMPDDGRMPLPEKLTAVRTIRRVSQKPLLVDCDNGQGDFSHTARAYAKAGVSGLVVEDKCGQKHNSLYGSARAQLLEDPLIFAQKLSDAKAHAPEILLFARLESLIAGQSMEDALERANLYAKAGADGIVIHSLDKAGGQVLEFCHRCKQLLHFGAGVVDAQVQAVPIKHQQSQLIREQAGQRAGMAVHNFGNDVVDQLRIWLVDPAAVPRDADAVIAHQLENYAGKFVF